MDGSLDLGLSSPVAAFDRLFAGGGAASTSSTAPADRLRSKRRSILDAVKASFDRTLPRLGADDRNRLQHHADQIRELELGLDKTATMMCDNPRLNPPQPLPARFEDSEGRYDDIIAAAHIGLIATAFSCQATRVAHLHFSNIQNNTFPWLNDGEDFITGGWHTVVHNDTGTDDQRLRTMKWYTQVLADLLTRLSTTPEGPGTLLDNTVVLFLSSLRQSYHGTTDLPILLAGNLAGSLRTGRHIRYGHRTTGDLFTTLLNALDVPATSFGWNAGSTADGRSFNNGPFLDWS
jgi:hypothetical protein